MKYTVIGEYTDGQTFVDYVEDATVKLAANNTIIRRLDAHIDIIAIFEGHHTDLYVGN